MLQDLIQSQEIPITRFCNICNQQDIFEEQLEIDDQVILSDHSNIILYTFQLENGESDLIMPCYCNKIVHRFCLKKQILQNRKYQCQECAAQFQSLESNKIFAQNFNRSKQNSIIVKTILNIFTAVIIALTIYYILLLKPYLMVDFVLQIVTFVLATISLILSVFYISFLVFLFQNQLINYFQRIKIFDIYLLCYQTQIPLHNDKEYTKIFLENLQYSGLYKQN